MQSAAEGSAGHCHWRGHSLCAARWHVEFGAVDDDALGAGEDRTHRSGSIYANAADPGPVGRKAEGDTVSHYMVWLRQCADERPRWLQRRVSGGEGARDRRAP